MNTKKSENLKNRKFVTKKYIIENLDCANCAAKIEKAILAVPRVEEASLSFPLKQLTLTAESPDQLIPELTAIAQKIEDGVLIKKAPKNREKHDHQNEKNRDLVTLVVAALMFLGTVIFKFASGIEEYNISSIIIFIISYLLLGGKILLTAGKNILKGKIFDENFLMSIATLGAFAIGEYPEAVGVMLFFRVGELFESIAVSRSRSQIMDAIDLRPETVNILSGDDVKTIPAEEAKVSDIVLVRPGDRVPLDGIIIEGESRLDTSAVTGESVPVKVKEQDRIMSGCVNQTGVLKVKVEKVLGESMVSRILESVENAASSKPQIDNFITRFARIYTPIVVAVAAFTAFIMPLILKQEFYPWIYTALTFLVMSCPCALVLSVPLAYFCGIGSGSKRGILFKGGVVMEALASVKSVVMDKTGTITKGNFVVQSIVPTGNSSQENLLQICASCEMTSTHPIAESIVSEAKRRNLALSRPTEMKEISGKGINATLDGRTVLVGNTELMQAYEIDISSYNPNKIGSEVLIAVDGKFAGYILIADTIKSEAKSAIGKIKKHGVVTAMLTGDSEEIANQVALDTGIEEVHAKLLPEDKLNELKSIRESHGKVMFVGDGINDAPVLAGADVGAAMGSGADAAIEAADIVFMNSNMDAIPMSISISKKTTSIAKQNVIVALIIKIAVMILGISGIYANMWLAVFADTGVAFLCILNSIRAMYGKFE